MKAAIAIKIAARMLPTTAPMTPPLRAFADEAETAPVIMGCSEIEVLNGSPPVCKLPVDSVNSFGGIGSTR